MASKIRYNADERETVAGASGVATGTLDSADGSVWYSQNLNTVPEGQQVAWKRRVVIELDKDAAATTFAAYADVGYDATNKVAVAATTGDYDCGKARVASTANDATVIVELLWAY